LHRNQEQECVHLTQERTYRSSESAAAAKSEDQDGETTVAEKTELLAESEENDVRNFREREESEGAAKEKNKEFTNEKTVESGDEIARDNPSADLPHEKRDQHDLSNTECHTVSKEIKTPVEELRRSTADEAMEGTREKPLIIDVETKAANQEKPLFNDAEAKATDQEKPLYSSADAKFTDQEKPLHSSADTKATDQEKPLYSIAEAKATNQEKPLSCDGEILPRYKIHEEAMRQPIFNLPYLFILTSTS
jgi:hypothetical protein